MNLLKRGLLLFWALYFTVVLATDVCDALQALGALPASWTFASGNFAYMKSITSRHHTPDGVTALLFAAAIVWVALAVLLHWLAALRFPRSPESVLRAFVASIWLWCAFIIADEVYIAHEVEATHFRLLIAALVSVLLLRLLPDERTAT